MFRLLTLSTLLLYVFAPMAQAHAPGDGAGIDWLRLALLASGVITLAWYLAGVARLWRRAGIGHGLRAIELVAFLAGALALFFALVWPLDQLGENSLAAHMAQHMLLLAVAPPLLLIGRPAAMFAQTLPVRWLRGWHRSGHAGTVAAQAWLAMATLAHCAVMLVWHLPATTAAALANEPLHWAMHGSFLLAGLWFWSAMLRRVREPQAGIGPALVAIVVVMMTMGLLGALLVFSGRPLFPVYVERAPILGLDPLVDQQLAGLIMWVPAALPYLLGGLWLTVLALRWQQRLDAMPGGQA